MTQSSENSLEQGAPIKGVFSSQEIRKVGTGTTTRKTVQKIFWFVEQDGDTLMMQSINMNFVPTGKKRIITLQELLEKFSPEPEFYMQSVYPKMREVNDSVKEGDSLRDQGKHFSAEFEYSNALTLDEENVRANFGIALTYLSRGERDKASNIFERLVNLEATYEQEHKHLFNELGISLRKSAMLGQSIEYYTKALGLTKNDDNLHINMARALLESENYGPCVEHLFLALSINPENEVAIKFLDWLVAKKHVPEDMQSTVTEVKGGIKYTKSLEDIHEAVKMPKK